MPITESAVLDALRNVEDPDLKQDLVTLNMIKDLLVDGNRVAFTVELTTPACPMKDHIRRACETAVKHLVDQEAEITINMSSKVTSIRDSDSPILPGVKNIVAVVSGKGGVGKSTVAVNLAMGLARRGARTGLLDADIYGPSAPTMLGLQKARPQIRKEGERNIMMPVEHEGIKVLSIGFLVDESQAVVWRGPMASSALRQFVSECDWGELDYLVIDMPPGTGDLHLTLVQTVPVTGGIVVTTPQDVALADARKGISMFRNQNIKVPVLGIVENMAWFTPAELPDKRYHLFGEGGGARLAEEAGVPLLGQIPIVQGIREGGDSGRPAILDESDPITAEAFGQLADNVAQQVSIRNAEQAPTEKVEIERR